MAVGSANEVDRTLKIASRRVVADNVVLLDLVDPSGASLPSWEAGAHIDLVLGADLVRQYSLCSSPSDLSKYQVAVLREEAGRGGSKRIFDDLHEGDSVVIRGPRNHFPLVGANHYVFIAGGIGVTPMLPMLEAAEAAGADWKLYYGGHTRASMAFADELLKYGDRVELVVRDEVEKSLRHRLPEILGHPRGGCLVYCCGPEGLIAAAEELSDHWAKGSFHSERFTPVELDDSNNHAFEVVLQRSGMTLHVPADRSIVEVVQDAGVTVLTSCKDGVCGTCETFVLEGEIEHRDAVFNAEERATAESMMICVSRCKGEKLVLDL